MSKKKLYTVTSPKTQESLGKAVGLPELPGRHGAPLESAAFGPRHEMTVKRANSTLWSTIKRSSPELENYIYF